MCLLSNILILLAVTLPTLANGGDKCKVGTRKCEDAFSVWECQKEGFFEPPEWKWLTSCGQGDDNNWCSNADAKCHGCLYD
ncbi:hypothetical protein AA0119_g11656 [Alternaria tenuissima]|uniref:Uncharacterized protein n=1 Tax=Alternaria tenuissima TaxID=119927 RepID=A0A4Q4RIN0_9PLEO|nr:hypothetical protein AA0115_g8798 [Alternaria tenuissima]RYN89114.1 hypothetical protein AA0119_g11656 [Alternaria tenuissima]RYO13626.1 hypothetical protein AA0121_g8382 [Alternaria tenuissima]RYO56662.1 hypothetical protein AA0116_g8271 [Alternaria tenuissima]